MGKSYNNERILVIGNGFDLYHGMATGYDHFLAFVKEVAETEQFKGKDIPKETIEEIRKNGFINYFRGYKEKVEGWIDFEALIKEVVEFFAYYTKNVQERFDEGAVEDAFITRWSSPLPKEVLVEKSFPGFFELDEDEEYYILGDYFDDFKGIKKEKLIDDFRKELDILRATLTKYLSKYEQYCREAPYVAKSIIQELRPKEVVSFNYTDTYEKLYGNAPVLYIHGSLKANNIVLGYNEEIESNREEADLDYVYFYKYFQRIKYNTDILPFDITKEGPQKVPTSLGPRDRDVYFFGYSLDLTDREQLEILFDTIGTITVFYLDETDFERKIINIIKLLGKHDAVNRIKEKGIVFEQIPSD